MRYDEVNHFNVFNLVASSSNSVVASAEWLHDEKVSSRSMRYLPCAEPWRAAYRRGSVLASECLLKATAGPTGVCGCSGGSKTLDGRL